MDFEAILTKANRGFGKKGCDGYVEWDDAIAAMKNVLIASQDALKPFATVADDYLRVWENSAEARRDEGHPPPTMHPDSHRVSISLGDCRRARATLDQLSK